MKETPIHEPGKHCDSRCDKRPGRRLVRLANPREEAGVAMFYEKPAAIRQRAAWVTYRPALHPVLSVRKTPNEAVEISMSFKDRALRCRDRYRRELRYVFLGAEEPDDVRLLYKLWGGPLEETAVIGWPEIRPRECRMPDEE